jgi:NADP-dependent 3-hydroxy acid dehydrogenase YdfG
MTEMEADLAGARVLVTGASSGIGESTALAFAAAGAAVVLAARREGRLRDLADRIDREYGTETVVVPTDVTDPDAVAEMVARSVEALGGLDVVVNNAGILRMAERLEDMPVEAYRAMRAVNVDGMFYTARAALPYLRESEGTLVFVGSDSAKHADPMLATYAATKWWTRGFALSLEAREGRHGVSVSVVNPGDTVTDINFEGRPLSETIDPGDALAPAEVASAIVFAASQESGSTVAELDLYDTALSASLYGGADPET